ncbi:hypothetical protein CEE37_05075 [candidate division LCP-89 bacterium B3_LCP]|uniref:Uncharacterized protein n=1 Tax=candidate division LCP-89 bacterium B3_LCP TaxID=2012998 RepID=A0A532V1E6_UNCL8|nr:MAG: hypothetical protein CEE37_05075 [candidate division LCP-89 bacterium B3_LCP]
MPLNPTENYLRERRNCTLMNFAEVVTTNNRYLKGPGGYSGDGYPMPAPGKILRLKVYDDTSVQSSSAESSFNAGDRISVIAEYDQPWFDVTVQINGVNSATYCNMVQVNCTLRASVLLRLDVY